MYYVLTWPSSRLDKLITLPKNVGVDWQNSNGIFVVVCLEWPAKLSSTRRRASTLEVIRFTGKFNSPGGGILRRYAYRLKGASICVPLSSYPPPPRSNLSSEDTKLVSTLWRWTMSLRVLTDGIYPR